MSGAVCTPRRAAEAMSPVLAASAAVTAVAIGAAKRAADTAGEERP